MSRVLLWTPFALDAISIYALAPATPPATSVIALAGMTLLSLEAVLKSHATRTEEALSFVLVWFALGCGTATSLVLSTSTSSSTFSSRLNNILAVLSFTLGQAFTASKQAYAAGDGEQARSLSMQGKVHQQNRDQLHAKAAAWIFEENNEEQPPGWVDLHGLYVHEAIEYAKRAIKDGRASGWAELRLIVGKGSNSPSNVAKIRPAVSALIQRENLAAQMDQRNAGVLVVHLQGQSLGWSAGQFAHETEQTGDTCFDM
ncbi:hypothetical protein JCM10908_001096 [Rhodotorula pacifica]|uniref:Smr/MutS family protein n=1 Tax=Rhodotorula pacifica TaxID=1495444 RepID=UPI00316DAEC8